MPKRTQRAQKPERITSEDTRPLVIHQLPDVANRLHNPKDLDIDTAAIANGITHGGTQENRAEALMARGSGGRKRSGPFGRHRVGRDLSKRR